MSHQLVSHNDDLRRLVDKGYARRIDRGYGCPGYPLSRCAEQLQWAAFVAKLELVDKLTVRQDDHQIWFAGSVPHGLDGKPIPNLGGGPTALPLGRGSKDVVVQRRFSNKPMTGRTSRIFTKRSRVT